ncbi:hypothetical protein HCU40_21300 (plasmid) [Pseudanabaena biceps]|nr:hypothetical protein [Pseudanabaena biceps]
MTAIGQSQAYIHKGYSGSVIIIPNAYDSYSSPGQYVADVLDRTNPDLSVGVFTYDLPDTNNPSPFLGKINCWRNVGLSNQKKIVSGNFLLQQKSSTQWAHVREGSTEPHAFMKYLQIAKQKNATELNGFIPTLPQELIDAVLRIKPNIDPYNYLSYASGSLFHDVVWRCFWFENILTNDVSTIWQKNGNLYTLNPAYTQLKLYDGSPKKFFFGRKGDSVKNKIVDKLNQGSINENQAWEEFARNVNSRAHSYREDLDSGLEHLGLIDTYGKPSEIGYQFVDACERGNDCFSGKAKLILGTSLLKKGGFAAFLHYIYKVSEKEFKRDQLAFTTMNSNQKQVFDKSAYLFFVRDELANTLSVMNTSSVRGGTKRLPFQGEFAILRKFQFVDGFRIGVGLEVNWPLVQEFLEYDLR